MDSLRVSVSVGLRWNLRICISLKFSSDAEAAGDHPLRDTDYKITLHALTNHCGTSQIVL